MTRARAQFGFNAFKHVVPDNVDERMILEAVSALELPRSANVLSLLKFDAAKIAADFSIEQRSPLTSTRTANLKKVAQVFTKLEKDLSGLKRSQLTTIESGLRHAHLFDLSPAEIAFHVTQACLWLDQDKYRLKRSPFDRSIQRCSEVFGQIDHILEADLFDGLCLAGTRPYWVPQTTKSDALIFYLHWLANAASAIQPFVSEAGPRRTPGLHTTVAYLAPRFEDLCPNARASYWGLDEETHNSAFEQFVAAMFRAAQVEIRPPQISRAIRSYCQARNAAERQNSG